jgi:outer membrane protein W
MHKLSVLSLVLFSALIWSARAQSVLPHSTEAAGTVGLNGNGGADNSTHVSLGLSGAYNWTQKLAYTGEFSHQWMGSTLAERQNILLFGVGARYYLTAPGHIAPYVAATGGYARLDTNFIGTGMSTGESAGYIAGGAGVSFYVAENWGIRPEIRYQYELLGTSDGFSGIQGSISAFYQFGGTEPGKKK